jgi:hypothetical protein
MNWKKALLLLVLSVLLLVEADLLEGFLPYQRRHAIDQRFERLFPSRPYAPHPDMDWEFELMFRQNPRMRDANYIVLGLLALVDGYLFFKVWRALFQVSPATGKQQNSDYS